MGAEKEFFDDSSWRELDLPHDWAIEGPLIRHLMLEAEACLFMELDGIEKRLIFHLMLKEKMLSFILMEQCIIRKYGSMET